MIAFLVRGLDAFAQAHLAGVAGAVRAAAAAALVLAWIGPFAAPGVRFFLRRRPIWRCFKCGRWNLRRNNVCARCLAGLSDAVLKPPPTPRPPAFYRWVLRPARALWAVGFYSSSSLLVGFTGFWGAERRVLESSASSIAVLGAAAAFGLGFSALGPWAAFLEQRVLRALGALWFGVLAAAALFVWVVAPLRSLPGNRPFAVSPAGALRFVGAPREEIRLSRHPATGAVIVPVAGAVLRWPVFGVERWTVTRIAGVPTVNRSVRWTAERLASPAAGGWVSPFAPRLQLATVALEAPPPGVYDVAVDEKTGALGVRPRS